MRVVVVGAGTIGSTHAEVLDAHDQFDLVGAIDREHRDVVVGSRRLRTRTDFSRALADLSPDMVVIATPTGTHLDVVGQVLAAHPACRLLVEKPAVASWAELDRLVDVMRGEAAERLLFAHHTAYAPEVLWLARAKELQQSGGRLRSAFCVFQDPYANDVPGYRQRLGSSWVDSGINALSVLERFATVGPPLGRRHLDVEGIVEEVRVQLGGGDETARATIVTSWEASASAKSTRLVYESGMQVLLDHTGVTGLAEQDGRITHRFGTDGSRVRRIQHYRNLYDVVANGPDALTSWETTHRLLRTLLHAT